jgi:hypothetical protein
MTNQQMHVYKYVQWRIIAIVQHVSVTPVTTSRVPYKNATDI